MWVRAMYDEICSIEKNNMLQLTSFSEGRKQICLKWVYKTKYKPSKDIDKMKAHLVVKGYKQKTRINYEVFAPVAQSVTIKMIIGLVAKKKLENTPNGRQVCISK